VYCIEEADQSERATLDDLRLDSAGAMRESTAWGLSPSTVAVIAGGAHAPARWGSSWPYATVAPPPSVKTPRPTELVAIPYALWGNRSPAAMRVWIPVAG
jgi:hypothetical protein